MFDFQVKLESIFPQQLILWFDMIRCQPTSVIQDGGLQTGSAQ